MDDQLRPEIAAELEEDKRLLSEAAGVIERLQTELAEAQDLLAALLEQMQRDLEQQLAERNLIASAKELLQSTQGLSEEQAYSQLRTSSRKSRQRMADVAQKFIKRMEHAQTN